MWAGGKNSAICDVSGLWVLKKLMFTVDIAQRGGFQRQGAEFQKADVQEILFDAVYFARYS